MLEIKEACLHKVLDFQTESCAQNPARRARRLSTHFLLDFKYGLTNECTGLSSTHHAELQ